MTALSQSVAEVQRQVSIAAEEIEKLKETPMKRGSLTSPDEPSASHPTEVAR